MNAADRRAEARSSFPPSLRPVLINSGKTYPVLDMTKTSLCFAVSARSRLRVGDQFTGVLSHRGGLREPVAGRIVRVNRKCAVLRFQTAPSAQPDSG